MIERYKKELAELKQKMIKAEAFAEKLPVYRSEIIERKLSADTEWIEFGDRYKELPLKWGINRGFYRNGSQREITNYPENKPYKKHLFNMYFNSYSLFGIHENFGLEELKKLEGVFFFDKWNTNFYVEEEHIENFLEKANKWYIKARDELKEYNKKQEVEKLEKKLADLKKN